MSSEMPIHTADYRHWLGELKTRFRQVQLKAAVAVNSAMLQFYWELGADMVVKQTQFAWGSGFLNQLSADLMREFPDTRGFSKRNLELMRQWHLFWLDAPIGQQPVAQIAKQPVSQILSIPWGHNLAILAKCKLHDEALYHAQTTPASVRHHLRKLQADCRILRVGPDNGGHWKVQRDGAPENGEAGV
jgi:predicted nuclease of restriction endonuclease-like (RecB) superfamily